MVLIEREIIRYLQNKTGVPCSMEKPTPAKGEYTVVEKTAGSEENHIFFSTIAIQSYAPSLYEAAVLNNKVKEAMLSIADSVWEITLCKLNSDYNFTDTETKEYRYQAVFNLTHY